MITKRQSDIFNTLFGTQNDLESVIDKDSIEFFVDLPGFKLENINIQVNNSHAYISAKREDRRGTLDYNTRFYISPEYNQESIEANLDSGVLSVKFKRQSKPEARKIEIKSR